MTSLDSFRCCKLLKVGSKSYAYYSLAAAEKNGLKGISRLPFSMKVLLENLLRHEDGRSVAKEDIQAVAQWVRTKTSEREIPFRPARVLMQDFTGVPAVVDLAAMRDAMKKLGGDPKKINPLVPVDLVCDHSVAVTFFGSNSALKKNVDEEYRQNGERYEFLKWSQKSFDNFRVVPPGTGICHQVNLEYLSQTVWTRKDKVKVDGKAMVADVAYPDTLVGTDSHTTMINGLARGRLGSRRNRGRSEHARPAVFMLLPEVVGVEALRASFPDGADRDGLVLTVTEMLRKAKSSASSWNFLARRIAQSVHCRPRHHRKHVPRIWCDLRLLPGGRRYAPKPHRHRTAEGAYRIGSGLRQGARHVPHQVNPGSRFHGRAQARA